MPVTPKSTSSNPEPLLRRVKEAFPDISWKTFRYLDEGWDHEVLILDEQIVFRFPNDSSYLKLLRVEVEVLRQLQAFVSSVTIPNYTYITQDHSFAGYQIITGQTLTLKVFNALRFEDRTKIAKQLAGFLSSMHKITKTGDGFGKVSDSDLKETQAENRKLTNTHLKQILNNADFKLVEAILNDADKILGQSLPSVLLHGDVYSRHLLWDKKVRQLGIIDFSDMNYGDPAFDFAELHEYGEDFVQRVYDYYAGPKDDSFLNRARIYQKWVGVFMMLDYFIHHKTSFDVARETFERAKNL